MNIDTLRLANGSFRKATVGDIKRMLGAGHVTHLQTERGTIAVRPCRRLVDEGTYQDKGWYVDRSTGKPEVDRSQTKWFRYGEQVRLIRAALVFLNGSLHEFEAGDDVVVEVNQGDRNGYVLAVQGEQVLVEYEMPGGTSSLVLFGAMGNQLTRIKTIPHRSLSQAWINVIHNQGAGHFWIGKGQRMHEPMRLPAKRLILQN